MRKSIFNRIGVGMAACVAVGAIALAGCGGGSSSSSTGASGASGAAGSTPLSQSEFVSQANAVCKDSNAKTVALKAPTSSSDLASFLGQSVALANDAYAKLSAITPPADLQSQYAEFLAQGKSQIALATQAEAAAKSGDTAKVQALVQKLQAGNNDSFAKNLGLTECAKNVQPQG